MTDRELLELAARAAGIPIYEWVYRETDDVWLGKRADSEERTIYWAPLTDPSDALRMAVALHIGLDFQAPDYSAYWTVLARDYADFAAATENGPDPLAATMRAIVRAAAEIGRAKT